MLKSAANGIYDRCRFTNDLDFFPVSYDITGRFSQHFGTISSILNLPKLHEAHVKARNEVLPVEQHGRILDYLPQGQSVMFSFHFCRQTSTVSVRLL